MTILSKFIRDILERLLGIFHEGPEPPPRLADEVRYFRSTSSLTPTEEEWEAFTVAFAERAYRDGFVRGVHYLERSWEGPAVSPEQILEEAEQFRRPRDNPAIARVLDNPLSAREVKEFHDAIGRAAAAGIDVHLMPGRRES